MSSFFSLDLIRPYLRLFVQFFSFRLILSSKCAENFKKKFANREI